jgi:hypothetical protein
MIQSAENWRTSKNKVIGRSRQLTRRARGRLDSQRSGAEMGDGRSGMLPRPIAPPNWPFS